MSIRKIVLTGGPCAGKTTGMSWIQNAFTEKGYSVIFVPETPTEMITAGVAPWTCSTVEEFQRCLFRLQMEKEKVYDYAARNMKSDKVLIVLDRGLMDNKAYTTESQFAGFLSDIGLSEVEARDRYEAVFHLVTAAKGAVEYYTTSNNSARTETADQAAEADDRTMAAWVGHPHLRIIDNMAGFEYKMTQLISEISAFLGEEPPRQHKRKFLMEYPDAELLGTLSGCQKVEIVQTYLKPDRDEEVRIRQRGANGDCIYCEIRKKSGSGRNPIEVERRLTREEYMDRFMDRDPKKRSLQKNRYCFVRENQYFEIDVYPFWKDRAIIGVKTTRSDEQICFPEGVSIIREVTDDEEYRNSSLAGRP